jgi:hypothetical protein
MIMEDRTMKRLLLMAFILVTFAVAGMLHGGYVHHESAEEILASKECINHYPETMPAVVFDSITSIPF